MDSISINDLLLVLKAIVLCSSFITLIWKVILFIRTRYSLKPLYEYYSKKDIKKATKYFVRPHCQDVPPSDFNEPGESYFSVVRQDVIKFFLKVAFSPNKNSNKFFIVLADSGMGKTTFLTNLYIKYKKRFFKNYNITLLPLALKSVDDEIKSIPDFKKHKTIILLDALDEDKKAIEDYSKRLKELTDLCEKFYKVVITCRTQFFPSYEMEPLETQIKIYGGDKGYHFFHKFYLSPFSDEEVKKYLKKKFPTILNFIEREKAKKIIYKSNHLMVRPMLLSYIEYLTKTRKQLYFSYEIYDELITQWIKRESQNVKNKKIDQSLFKVELLKLSEKIALYIYKNGIKDNNLLAIDESEIESFTKDFKISLSMLEIKSNSLLNRNHAGLYKFSHKSILEYFLADELIKIPKSKDSFNFTGMDQTKKFYDEMYFFKIALTYFKSEEFDYVSLSSNNAVNEIQNEKWAQLVSNIELEKNGDIIFKSLFKTTFWKAAYNAHSNISYFECLTNLETLWLSHNKFKHIINLNMPNLKYLDLSNNRIETFTINNLNSIEYLNIENNKITNLDSIIKYKNIKVINLTNNPISQERITYLANHLPFCKILTSKSKDDTSKNYYDVLLKRNYGGNLPLGWSNQDI